MRLNDRHSIRATILVNAGRAVTIEFNESFEFRVDANKVADKLAALVKEAAKDA
jgi:hypothetical protein